MFIPLTEFSVKTKRGERRSDVKGLSYNTNKDKTREERQKRHSRWEHNKNEKAAENRGRKDAKTGKK